MALTCNYCSTVGPAQVQPRGHVNVRESFDSGRVALEKPHGASTVETVNQVPGCQVNTW